MGITGLNYVASFDGGWLALDAVSCVARMRWQPDPVAELWRAGSADWEHIRPDFRLVGTGLPEAFSNFQADVPEEVVCEERMKDEG